MTIHGAALQLMLEQNRTQPNHQTNRAIRRLTWVRNNAYLHLASDGELEYVCYGNVAANWYCQLEDLIAEDWEVCDSYV